MRKPRFGEPPLGPLSPLRSHRSVSTFADVADAHQRAVLWPRPQTAPGAAPTIVKVRNDTGATIKRGYIIQIGNPLVGISSEDEESVLEVDADDENRIVWPQSPWYIGNKIADPVSLRFGIALHGMRSMSVDTDLTESDIGPVVTSGLCIARVSVVNHLDTTAVAVADSFVLKSAQAGPFEVLSTLLGADEGTERDVWVRFSPPAPRYAILSADLTNITMVDAVLQYQDNSRESGHYGALTASAFEAATVKVVAPLLDDGKTLPSGCLVWIEGDITSGLWNVIAAKKCAT